MPDNIEKDSKITKNYNILYIVLTVIALIFFAGVIYGFLNRHDALTDDAISDYVIGIITGIITAMILLSAILIKLYKKFAANDISVKEKKRRDILVLSGIAGGIIGVILSLQSATDKELGFYHTYYAPVPTLLALALAFFWVICMPIICYYYYKLADEQEIYATRIGTYYSLYIYMIGAPTWWILWRGGLVPEPNGVIIYFITIFSFGGIYLWKKHRG